MDKFCSQCGQPLPEAKDTHMVFLMDMSGSMWGSNEEAMSAFNSFIEDQKKVEGDAYVSLICFDTVLEHPYTHRVLNEVPVLTSEVYQPRGMTALFDAINFGISEYKPTKTEKVVFIIITDGEENASRKVRTKYEMQKLISAARENGAEFIFLAADEATFAQGTNIGIPVGNVYNYGNTSYTQGTATVSRGMSNFRGASISSTTAFFDDFATIVEDEPETVASVDNS